MGLRCINSWQLRLNLETSKPALVSALGSCPQCLLDYTYKPQFVIMDLKVPDCGFNHSHITVDFYLQKDKNLCGLGKGWFWGKSPGK